MGISKRLRFQIFQRDGFACVYCGRRTPAVTLEVDHRIPRCAGGSDDPSNLVSACWDCNRGKGPVNEETGLVETLDEWAERQLESWTEANPDKLPSWMFDRQRKPIQFDFDVYAAAEELPKSPFLYGYTPEAIANKANLFGEPHPEFWNG